MTKHVTHRREGMPTEGVVFDVGEFSLSAKESVPPLDGGDRACSRVDLEVCSFAPVG